MVRINHFRGCLLCHPASHNEKDLVRGGVPTTDAPIPSGSVYYRPHGVTITARITYLRQDFSVPQLVTDAAPWPGKQRFDFLTRERPATPAETRRLLEGKLSRSNEPAIVHALKYLTGEDAGSTGEDWKKRFLNREVKAELRLQGLTDARAITVDEAGTVLVAERERILRLPRDGVVNEWHYSVAPIRDLALDARGALWVAMERATALQRVDLRTQVRSTPTDPRTPLHEPLQLTRDKHRGLYIVQGDGKMKYQSASGTLTSVAIGSHRVQAAALNVEGDHLYLAIGNDLWRARVVDAGQIEKPIRLHQGKKPITRLAVDEREVLVIGNDDGLHYLSPEGLPLGQTPLSEPVVALAVHGSHAHVLTSIKLRRIELAAISRP
jgi:ligand-binding sensor domain-containing protein